MFQSTRPMRGATSIPFHLLFQGKVSIHAPHAGRDRNPSPRVQSHGRFNPRAPCRARLIRRVSCSAIASFQSTRPMRGTTPHGWRRSRGQPVSIHAPHAGRDQAGHT